MPARVLITGGAGFIGSHLAEAMLARGDLVTVFDDLSTGRLDNVQHLADRPGFTLRQGSVLDQEQVCRLVGSAELVIHLAAAVGVKRIIERPLESLIVNIRGTENVLDAAERSGAKVLLTSSSEVYGKNANGPLHEDADRILGSPFKARWSYSTAKVVDEVFAYTYWRERGVATIVVRLFNTVGPRQTGVYGMVIPRFVRQVLAGEDLTVFGTGGQRRCFCHVTDVVAALLALLDHPDAVGGVFNVGSQEEVSINRLAELVVEKMGSDSTIVHVPYEVAYEAGFEDMERRIPDTGRIEELTAWRPTRSLADILEDVIDFELARGNGGGKRRLR